MLSPGLPLCQLADLRNVTVISSQPFAPLSIGVDYRRRPLFWHLGDLVLYTFLIPELRIPTVPPGEGRRGYPGGRWRRGPDGR
jgi:hypothetical protein